MDRRMIFMIMSMVVGMLFRGCADSPENSGVVPPQASEDTFVSDDIVSNESEDVDVYGSLISNTESPSETYKNHLLDCNTENAWGNYGFGDPFVMRHNGKYYLYSSTKDGENQIKVWTSDNLVDWKYGGICVNHDMINSAYAPEVVYYNGYFYMYTSPAGKGHYVLRATDPLGPFSFVTENLGNGIDGHVFIDDDGKWYFYYASHADIKVKQMLSPLDISLEENSTGVGIKDMWTEGPMVIKRDGVYYLTYCGNHVWSKGYRIKGAVSTTNPMQFKDVPEGIVLINTSSSVYGIGHSSTVLGPDLDTYYIVYHSFDAAPKRRMNIDPVVLNGVDMSVLGPTTTEQQAPVMPEIVLNSKTVSDKFDYISAYVASPYTIIEHGGKVLTKNVIEFDKYTFEINFKSIKDKAGMLFGYVDEKNYSIATIDAKNNVLKVSVYKNGKISTSKEFELPTCFDEDINFSAIQSLTLRKDGASCTFLFNAMEIGKIKLDSVVGKAGVWSVSDVTTIGYTAISNKSNGSGLRDLHKPIETEIASITSVEDGETVFKNGIEYTVMKQDFVRNYYVNISQSGTYDLEIPYYSTETAVFEIYQGGKLLKSVTLPASQKERNSVCVRNLSLTQGYDVISFKVTSGSANVLAYTFTKSASVNTYFTTKGHYFKDGTWVVQNNKLVLQANNNSTQPSHGKIFYGNEGWGDYTASASFRFNSENGKIGMIVRGTEPSIGGADDNSVLGKDAYFGYYICLDYSRGLVVYKVNYESGVEMFSYPCTFKKGSLYTVKTEAVGNTLKIYLSGTLVGEVVDKEDPFLNGMFGFTGFEVDANVESIFAR